MFFSSDFLVVFFLFFFCFFFVFFFFFCSVKSYECIDNLEREKERDGMIW